MMTLKIGQPGDLLVDVDDHIFAQNYPIEYYERRWGG